MTLKIHKQNINLSITVQEVLYFFSFSPNEPVHFLGFFASWIRIRICICPSGSRRHFFMRIRVDPDPKH